MMKLFLRSFDCCMQRIDSDTFGADMATRFKPSSGLAHVIRQPDEIRIPAEVIGMLLGSELDQVLHHRTPTVCSLSSTFPEIPSRPISRHIIENQFIGHLALQNEEDHLRLTRITAKTMLHDDLKSVLMDAKQILVWMVFASLATIQFC